MWARLRGRGLHGLDDGDRVRFENAEASDDDNDVGVRRDPDEQLGPNCDKTDGSCSACSSSETTDINFTLPNPPQPTSRGSADHRPSKKAEVRIGRSVRSTPAAPARRGLAILVLFAGCARFSGCCQQKGLRIAPPFDIGTSCDYEITKPRVIRCILGWIKSGKIWMIWLGTPCTIWISARSDPRDPDEIQDPAAVATVRILRTAHQHNVQWVLENPIGSKLFK